MWANLVGCLVNNSLRRRGHVWAPLCSTELYTVLCGSIRSDYCIYREVLTVVHSAIASLRLEALTAAVHDLCHEWIRWKTA